MKELLTITALIEAGTGIALAVAPSWAVLLLLGSPLDGPAASVICRVLAAALLSLALACWFARDDIQGHTVTDVVAAMLLYNIMVVAVLCHTRIGLGMAGIALLPAVILHSVLSFWCVANLRMASRKVSDDLHSRE